MEKRPTLEYAPASQSAPVNPKWQAGLGFAAGVLMVVACVAAWSVVAWKSSVSESVFFGLIAGVASCLWSSLLFLLGCWNYRKVWPRDWGTHIFLKAIAIGTCFATGIGLLTP